MFTPNLRSIAPTRYSDVYVPLEDECAETRVGHVRVVDVTTGRHLGAATMEGGVIEATILVECAGLGDSGAVVYTPLGLQFGQTPSAE